MKYIPYTLLAVFLLCSLKTSAQTNDLSKNIESLKAAIKGAENVERVTLTDSLIRFIEFNEDYKYDSIIKANITLALKIDAVTSATRNTGDLIYYKTNVLGDAEEGLRIFKNFEGKEKDSKNFMYAANIYSYTGDTYYILRDMENSLKVLQTAMQYAIKAKKNERQIASIKQRFGNAHIELGNFSEAISYLQDASMVFRNIKDTIQLINTNASLSVLYSQNKFYKEAENVRNEAIALAQSGKLPVLTPLYYNAALDYRNQGDNNNWIKYLLLTENKVKTSEYRVRLEPNVLNNLVIAYANTDSIAKAEAYLHDVENSPNNYTAGVNKTYYIEALKQLNFAKGNYVNALKYGKEHLALKRAEDGFVEIYNAEKFLADVYEQLGDVNNKNTHLNAYYQIKDSISSIKNVQNMSFYQTKFETALKENEIIKQDAEIKQLESDQKIAKGKQKTLYTILIASFLLMTGLTYYLLERAKRKRKVIAAQLTRSKEELTSFTKQMLVKGKEQEILKKELDSLKSLYGEKEEHLELQELVDSRILTNEDWATFKSKFANVYKHFFIDLKNKGFKFSDAEERLISLEKLTIKTNEIANMLGISPDSVHTARYRLRKKLNIPKEIAILDFLKA